MYPQDYNISLLSHFPLASGDKPFHQLRVKVYIVLILICICYIIFLSATDKDTIKTKYFNRSDFIQNLDESHKLAIKELVVETIEEYNHGKKKTKIIKDKLKDMVPFLLLSACLRFNSYKEISDFVLTGSTVSILVFMLNHGLTVNK